MRTLITAALAGVSMASSDHWAVLVAGSNTYSNYRHQSDVHHAYQIMKANGIPEDQIILMSYDDIANNSRNPFPGEIFNHPNGENVYFQDDISYSGRQVTPTNFLAVLKGDSATTGGKPVLKSDSNSKVFVYYADHGAPGFVCFPAGGYLYADQVQDAIDYMEANQMFNELVFYVEACESGSMFPDLDASNASVYAFTASNASQSSYASYCGLQAHVDGQLIGSCLGDLFSTNWMEDTEAADISSETLTTQYDTVKELTTASPVQIFGDLDIMDEVIGVFEGDLNSVVEEKVYTGEHKKLHKIAKWGQKVYDKYQDAKEKIKEHLGLDEEKNIRDQRDAGLMYLFDNYMTTGSADDLAELNKELTHRGRVDKFFATFVPSFHMDYSETPKDWDCYRLMINSYEAYCEQFSNYSGKYAKVFAMQCNTQNEFELSKSIMKMKELC